MAGPTFVRFVSAAPGRLVSRCDAPQSYIGARRASEEEIRATGERIIWIDGQVLPLTAEYCARFDRELRHQISNGDLVVRTQADHEAWLEIERKRDEEAHPPANAETVEGAVEDGGAPLELGEQIGVLEPAPGAVELPVEPESPPADVPRSRKQ